MKYIYEGVTIELKQTCGHGEIWLAKDGKRLRMIFRHSKLFLTSLLREAEKRVTSNFRGYTLYVYHRTVDDIYKEG